MRAGAAASRAGPAFRDMKPAHVRRALAPCRSASLRRRPAIPHVGTAYIALFNYAFAQEARRQVHPAHRGHGSHALDARVRGGRSCARCTGSACSGTRAPTSAARTAPYRQSERAAIYREHAETLLASGAAYRCFCTAERLEAVRHEQRRQGLFVGYDGLCRGPPAAEGEARVAAGEPLVVRLAMPRDGRDRLHRPAARRGEVRRRRRSTIRSCSRPTASRRTTSRTSSTIT